jgi:uncharacterized membrane protein YcgQ (UPF0703/DUF1980 family)
MPPIVKLQLSLEAFAEAISSLNLEEKRQLQDIIEQQIFEAEEAAYEDNAETQAQMQAVRAEYAAGESITIDEYLNRNGQCELGTSNWQCSISILLLFIFLVMEQGMKV